MAFLDVILPDSTICTTYTSSTKLHDAAGDTPLGDTKTATMRSRVGDAIEGDIGVALLWESR